MDIFQEQVKVYNERAQNFIQIQEFNNKEEKNDYDNFLCPEAITSLKSVEKDRVNAIVKIKRKKIWKPNKLELSKVVKALINRSEV